jgi:hypothetical protein
MVFFPTKSMESSDVWNRPRTQHMNTHHQDSAKFLFFGCGSALLFFVVTLTLGYTRSQPDPQVDHAGFSASSLYLPVRPEPDRFPPDSTLPQEPEGMASGSIELSTFSAGRDLTYITDDRAWWDSDNDTNDTEDDHSIHYAMEIPLRRLIELVSQEGGTLKIQDTYRGEGIHNPTSLHKEGRAVDLTCDEIGLERLAQLSWAAGFDWVYYESRNGKGEHVHASVRRASEGPQLTSNP